jgi:hypothetical protein
MWKDAIVRFVVIAGIVTAFSRIVFGAAAFIPTMTAFEFFANSVTIAIAYAGFKAREARNGFAGLLVWYILLTGVLFSPIYLWSFIMEATYIIGLAAAAYFYLRVAETWFANKRIQRILAGTLCIGFTHAAIVIFLEFVSWRFIEHPSKAMAWSYMNLRNGVLIGILSVSGMELAEYLLSLRKVEPKTVS